MAEQDPFNLSEAEFDSREGGNALEVPLAELCAEGVAASSPGGRTTLIASIHCSPDVRYDSTLVGKNEAVAAHYAALVACGELAPTIKTTLAESDVVEMELKPCDSVLEGL